MIGSSNEVPVALNIQSNMKEPDFIYHSMDYPDGRSFEGTTDHRDEPCLLQLDVRNKRVLDIAANDGFFSFWAEQNGASEVVAIDVDVYEKYDWGYSGAPKECETLGQQNKGEAFWYHHKQLNSNVKRVDMSVNDLDPEKHGTFDTVINYGLIYHLRHPVLALDKCRSVTTGLMYLETQIYPEMHDLPMALMAGKHTGLLGPTDYFWPTQACVCAWLMTADFPFVYAQDRKTKKSPNRQRFLACVSDEAKEKADKNNNFVRITEDNLKEKIR